jgi:large subunit GTPase 1
MLVWYIGPGLVFPTFINQRNDLVCNGILPIDQLKDYFGPVRRVCELVNQRQFADAYALSFATDRPFTAEELLRAHAHMRGWVLDHGRADNSRSSRIILKDFVKVITLIKHTNIQRIDGIMG